MRKSENIIIIWLLLLSLLSFGKEKKHIFKCKNQVFEQFFGIVCACDILCQGKFIRTHGCAGPGHTAVHGHKLPILASEYSEK